MSADKVALICPLDWGIGHATRCVPLVGILEEQGWKVIIAASERPMAFFRSEYPGLETVAFPGIAVRYPSSGLLMVPAMAFHAPALLKSIRQEHKALDILVKQTGASLVISDNRYGCWHPDIFSVFMTHQLNIQVPKAMSWVSPVLRKITRNYVGRYDECWIPDNEADGGLSGDLSHHAPLPPRTYFIGPLTRLSGPMQRPPDLPCEPAEIFIMISGPEPQRSLLESMLLEQLRNSELTAIIAGGKPGSGSHEIISERIHLFPHLPSNLMKYYIEAAEYVICRSGYSTMMDLAALGKPAIIIPTPGQTEQEYLARRFAGMNVHHSVTQGAFILKEALSDFSNKKGIRIRNDHSLIRQRIQKISDQALRLRE
jgi:UDP-N-acetylglucosamine transferase subunit ALG13